MNKKIFFTFVGLLVIILWSTPQPGRAQHAGHGGGMPPPSMTAPPVPEYQTGTIKGRVIELGNDSIVVEGKYKGKVQRVTLMMDAKTKRGGAIESGSEIKLKFREGPGEMLHALAIKAEKRK